MTLSPADLAAMRALVDTTRQGTHWADCYTAHRDCALLRLCDALEAAWRVIDAAKQVDAFYDEDLWNTIHHRGVPLHRQLRDALARLEGPRG